MAVGYQTRKFFTNSITAQGKKREREREMYYLGSFFIFMSSEKSEQSFYFLLDPIL